MKGIELSRRFYEDAVAPALGSTPHSAALLGPGSEMLGFDTERSHDHDWGAFAVVFVAPGERPTLPDFPGVRGVALTTMAEWSRRWLGFDPLAGVRLLDWLATPTQRLAEVTGGAVFHDGMGVLTPTRAALAWYPTDVWRYVLACQRRRIAQECNALGLSAPLQPTLRLYYERPYQVLEADRFAEALWAAVEDPAVRALPRIGAIDQFVDNTDLVGSMARCRAVTAAALSAHG